MKQIPNLLLLALVLLTPLAEITAQPDRWQQEIKYDMDIVMDVDKHQFTGTSVVHYINHSPDTLFDIYYHLYFNVFQPNSMMDIRSRTILDPDGRVRDRIYHLKEDEIGYHKIKKLEMNGHAVNFEIVETTLEARLPQPILPGDTATFVMDFNSQVPLQIRRSGRDNREGIDYSMAQWYPKVAEYDYRGWHTSPYIGREFYGVWGDFNVKITIDSSYTIGSTGYLQNPQEIGHGYEDPDQPLSIPNTPTRTWYFYAPQVHDFVWAADPDFVHYQDVTKHGAKVHIIYQKKNNPSADHWLKMGNYTARAIDFMSDNYGQYPWKQFSVVQGGDGGMEYPMVTLVTGHRNLGSLVGVMAHELAHMWYYGMMATNESYYPWMDEGFTSYTSNENMAHLFNREGDPHVNTIGGYLYLKNLGLEEPLTTHSDRYETNFAYGTAAYTMGSMFLNQLGYIVGRDVLEASLKRYYNTWKFKHPNEWDFIREVEKESGLELDWFVQDWIRSTKTIDYGIKSISDNADGYEIVLERKGDHLMPIDLYLEYDDGSAEIRNIPMVIMRGTKSSDYGSTPFSVETDWRWVDQNYTLTVPRGNKKLVKVQIDPSLRMADINRLDNSWPFPVNRSFMEPARPSYTAYGYSWRPALWYGDLSGVRLGITSYGSYIFGNQPYEANVMLSTGSLNNYSAIATDIDYYFSYEWKLKDWGLETYLKPELRRYYGINEEALTLRKQIGKYGMLTKTKQYVSFAIFHQVKTSERNVLALQGWNRKDVTGMRFGYDLGTDANGISLSAQAASAGKNLGASYATASMNKTYEFGQISTRFGFSVGTGSKSLPAQYRFTQAGPSLEQLWKNHTYWSVANIHPDIIDKLNMYPTGLNGMLGYGMAGVGSPDKAGNNYFTFSIWNDWNPVKNGLLKPLTLEAFSGLGQSWDGLFINDFPILSKAGLNNLLASAGVGASYSFDRFKPFSKWTPQSKFLQDLKLSVRVPFYMHGLQGRDDFGAWFVFGITDSF